MTPPKRRRGAPAGLPSEAPKRKRGAPKGNRNAVRHGYYSKNRAGSIRQVLVDSGYSGADLDIVQVMWQLALLNGSVAGPEVLNDASFKRLFALVRRKYDLPRRGPCVDLPIYFIRLCLDLVFTPPVQQRLALAMEVR